MFHILTPELEEETTKAVERLREPVNELNEKLSEFPMLVCSGFVRFPKKDLMCMPVEYNKDFHEWLQNGAITDFVTKMSNKYRYFDADRYDEEGREGSPNNYVTIQERTVILGTLGSIWIDIPLTGTVHNKQVTKWTRAAFVYQDHWMVMFDPTADEYSFMQVTESEKFVKLMLTAGFDVDV